MLVVVIALEDEPIMESVTHVMVWATSPVLIVMEEVMTKL